MGNGSWDLQPERGVREAWRDIGGNMGACGWGRETLRTYGDGEES